MEGASSSCWCSYTHAPGMRLGAGKDPRRRPLAPLRSSPRGEALWLPSRPSQGFKGPSGEELGLTKPFPAVHEGETPWLSDTPGARGTPGVADSDKGRRPINSTCIYYRCPGKGWTLHPRRSSRRGWTGQGCDAHALLWGLSRFLGFADYPKGPRRTVFPPPAATYVRVC